MITKDLEDLEFQESIDKSMVYQQIERISQKLFLEVEGIYKASQKENYGHPVFNLLNSSQKVQNLNKQLIYLILQIAFLENQNIKSEEDIEK